jgi:hypothetical protein
VARPNQARRCSTVVIDGVLFPVLELGVAWSDPDAAIADAINHIDQFGRRYAAATMSQAERQTF